MIVSQYCVSKSLASASIIDLSLDCSLAYLEAGRYFLFLSLIPFLNLDRRLTGTATLPPGITFTGLLVEDDLAVDQLQPSEVSRRLLRSLCHPCSLFNSFLNIDSFT
jgi:hypothetical protein